MTFLLACLLVAADPIPVETPGLLIPSARAGNSDLFLVDPDKGDTRNVTKSEAAEEIYPAWSPDGKRIAFVCKSKEHDFEIYVCDADGSNRKRVTTTDSPGGCLTPSWSADGKQIVYMKLPYGDKSGKPVGEVHTVDVDGKNDRVLLAESGFEPSWSPDGKSIAFIRKVANKPSALCCVSPDGSNLRVLCEDVGAHAAHFPAFSPDGKFIVLSIATDHGLQLALVPAAGGSLKQITHLPGFNVNPVWIAADRILFMHQPGSPGGGYASIKIDGTRLAVHSLTKLEAPQLVARPAMFVPHSVKPEIESTVKPAAFVEPAAVKKSPIKAAPVAVLPPGAPGAIISAAWAPNSKRFALSLEAGLVVLCEFEGHTIKPIEGLKGHEGPIECVAFASDGKLLLSGGADKTVRLWDIAKKGTRVIENDHEAGIDSLAVSGNGKWVATGDRDGKVKVRSAETAKAEREIAVCDSNRGGVHALAFGKGDTVLFSGCAKWGMPVLNGSVSAIDAANGKELWRTKGTMGGVFALAVSPDGTKLAGACLDTFVRIWDAKTGAELACWKGHTDRATGVVWAAGGKAVVSCGFDHTVRVWDASNGSLLHTLAAIASPVMSLAAAPDGKHVVCTGQGGAVCVWQIEEAGY